MNICVIQTAFAGDLILTTPMIEELHRLLPDASIDVLCIPSTKDLLQNNPAIRNSIVYDKRAGGNETRRIVRILRKHRYDIVLSPHRSFRSAALALVSGAKVRIAFATSSGAIVYTRRIPYDASVHDAQRNLSLVSALDDIHHGKVSLTALARLYPSQADYARIRQIRGAWKSDEYVCIAPGSVWATKRWTEEGFRETAQAFADRMQVVLIGGAADRALCERIADAVRSPKCISLAGSLSWLETAALIEGASVVISNDSAPVHVAAAMGTPVVEIYGATSPEYGFSPWQVRHAIVQRDGMDCRPCAMHGGNTCPIGTHECMRALPSLQVIEAAQGLLNAI